MSSERATAVAAEAHTEPFRYASTSSDDAEGGLREDPLRWKAQNTILRSVAEQLEKDALLRGIQEGICAADLQPYLVCHILQ